MVCLHAKYENTDRQLNIGLHLRLQKG